MPELPEIETIKNSLAPLWSARVEQVFLSKLAPVERCSQKAIRRALQHAQIIQLLRRGKYLIFASDEKHQLVLHLGMSGRLFDASKTQTTNQKHQHLKLVLSNGSILVYEDARRFGTLSLMDSHTKTNSFLKQLGPDYLDATLTAELFAKRLVRHPNISIKTALLHQGIAAGLGNIYACEALYLAGLDPRRLVKTLSKKEISSLLEMIRDRLNLGIQYGGTTISDYFNGLGAKGKMQNFLNVYGRTGKTLDNRHPVERIVQQNRSTWFCPKLQR